jgi:hypothetical protein
MPWSEELIREVQAFEGTCCSDFYIAESLDLSEDQVLDLMLDADIERCGQCGWIFECCMLEFDDEVGEGFCEQCRPELHDG